MWPIRNNPASCSKSVRLVCRNFLLLLPVGLLLFSSPIFAHHVDSLQQELSSLPDRDITWATRVLGIGEEVSETELDTALSWMGQAYSIFLSQNHYPGISQSALLYAELLQKAGDYPAALEVLNERLARNRAAKDTTGIAESLHRKGNTFLRMGQYDQAQTHYQDALLAFQSLDDSLSMGLCLNAMGNIQFRIKNYPQARQRYLEAQVFFDAVGDPGYQAMVTHNLSNIFSEEGKPKIALEYLFATLQYEERGEPKPGMVITLFNIGETYLDLKEYPKAQQFYSRALDLAEQFGDPESLITGLQGMGTYYNATGQPEQGRPYLEKALIIAEEIQNPNEIRLSLEGLIETEKLSGDFERALKLTNQYYFLEDSLMGLNMSRQLQELTVQYEAETREKDLQLAREREARATQRERSIVLVSVIAGALLLIIVVILIYTALRLRRFNALMGMKNKTIGRKNMELEEINTQLIDLNEEKDTLMGIVAHDLKAPLNKARGLTQVLEMSGDLNEQQQKVVGLMNQVFANGKTLIEELVLIGQLEASSEKIPMKEHDLADLVRETVESFRQTAALKSIEIDYKSNAEEIPFTTHKEYLGRVLDNLVSNAIKFSAAKTRVQLILEAEEKRNRIWVKDQGPGIPVEEQSLLFEKFTRLSARPTGGESSTGLGLYIVKELVEKLNGSITVESEPGKGTAFLLEFSSH